MDPEATGLVGRQLELPVLEGFLAGEASTRALVLSGEPGIGKTTLWEATIAAARERGFQVLSARSSEAETALSFVGLADLLDGIELGGIEEVPAPQLRALEVALHRAPPAGAPPDPLAISSGFLGVLRSVALRGPVLVAVDDIQVVDEASAGALAFVARRETGKGIRFLFSRRSGHPLGLEQAFEPLAIERLGLVGLSFGALNQLLYRRLGRSFPRWVLRWVFDSSQGNPLLALELGRGLVARGTPDIGAEPPVPDALEDLFGARINELPEPVRQALLAVALSGRLTRPELASVVGQPAVEDALGLGLLALERSRIRPSHPLLAAAATARASARERRELHLALADAVHDVALRARHLALAADEPDLELAASVSQAVALATERGAFHDAVELAGHALRLTPEEAAEHPDRLLALAQCLATAGDYSGATKLLNDRIETLPAGRTRTIARLLLGEGAPLAVEDEQLEKALSESEHDPELRARVLARQAALLAANRVERLDRAEALAEEALTAAQLSGGEVERRAAVALAWARVMRGRPIDDLSERYPSAPTGLSSYDSLVDRPLAVRLAFRGQLDAARVVCRRLLALADERGEARSGVVFHHHLCEFELRAGDVRAATTLVEEWEHWTALEESQHEIVVIRQRLVAVLAAIKGDSERAEELAAAVLAACESMEGLGWERLDAWRTRSLAAVLEQDLPRAVASLRFVWTWVTREHVDDPGAFPVAADFVEALVESGEVDEARDVSARLRGLADAQAHPWGLATAERCEAAIALADGHSDEAVEALGSAATAYSELGLGFDRARTLLCLGLAQRRLRKRAGARQSLDQAAAAFEELGCTGWAERARSELARVSGRRPADSGELTPSEQRVSELAASGMSNKEIAALLFVSVYTVEAHLSSAYAKLGVRSRTQLAGRLDSATAPTLDTTG